MKRQVSLLIVTGMLIAACGGAAVVDDAGDETQSTSPSESSQDEEQADSPDTTPGSSGGEVNVPPHLAPMAARWQTDFSKTTIDLNELLVGIPASDPRDRIPPIDEPQFETVAESTWIEDQVPGVLVEIDDDARFYPLSVMTRHEIVNDEIGGVPVAVTYCPLCNTAVAFDRRLGGDVLRLGVSGLLRNSDLVMWDNVTESLWQQITGEAIVGEKAGERLTLVGSAIVRYADFKDAHPDGLALGPDQGRGEIYGTNPYESYSSSSSPFLFRGEIDDRFPALERVVGVMLEEGEKAYPFSLIQEVRVVNDEIGGQPVAIFWGAADTVDALDRFDIASSKAIGTGVAYDPVVNGQTLTFEAVSDTEFTDLQTGTTWSILGKALEGELAGEELELLPHRNEFWFAWQAFFSEAEVWEG